VKWKKDVKGARGKRKEMGSGNRSAEAEKDKKAVSLAA